MGWEVLIPIIAQYGLPLAEKLWQKWSAKGEPTQADWAELKAIASQTARMRLVDALSRAGISLDDPKAVDLLSKVP